MTTDLFAVASSFDASAVLAAVPPECRRGVEAPPRVVTDDRGNVVLELGPWVPRTPARHFVPALSLLGTLNYSVRFELAIESKGRWSPWIASATLGAAPFPDAPSACEGFDCDVDVFVTPAPVERVRLRVRLAPGAVAGVLGWARFPPLGWARFPPLDAPWLVTLSASDLAPVAPVAPARPASAAVPVPSWSQMEEAEPIRLRICSPTSVAMVLGRWGREVEPAVLAGEILHEALGRYGVWPAAVRAAGLRGVPGYLLRFPSWTSAAWCLARGLPIVASLRWNRGELTGAPLHETDGHLVVLTGYDGDDVLVNDPAAPSRAEVPRRYRLAEIQRAWLERTGVGYVFFSPPS